MLKQRTAGACHTERRASLQKCKPEPLETATTDDPSIPSKTVEAQSPSAPTEGAESNDPSILPSIGLFAFWIALVGYVFFLSPNQTSLTDGDNVQRILGVLKDDVDPNPVFAAIFNLVGAIAPVYAGLLIPTGRSKNKVPAWPFVLVGNVLGSYALLPYFALWQPDPQIVGPPKKADLEGWTKLPLRALESKVTWALILCYALYSAKLFIAGGEAYSDYFELLFKSRAVHATTIDMILLCAFAPFWISNDAAVRGWKGPQGLLLCLSLVPVLGPIVYMILRPRDE